MHVSQSVSFQETRSVRRESENKQRVRSISPRIIKMAFHIRVQLTLVETDLLNVSKIQLNEEEMCCISKFCNQKCNFPCNVLQKAQDFLKRFSAILF